MTETVRGLVLLASVLLWLPFLPSVLDGSMSVEQGLIRYALALLLAWAGGAGLTALISGYAAASQEREQAAERELRRAEDEATA